MAHNNTMAASKLFRFSIISVCYLLTICITWWLASGYYATDKEILLAFKKIDTNLITSNSIIKRENKSLVLSWEQMSREPSLEHQSLIWYPKINSAFSKANSMVAYIENIKINLQQNEKLVLQNEPVSTLKDSLTNFAKRLIELLPEKHRLKFGKLPVQTTLEENGDSTKATWQDIFKKLPSITTLAILSKLQNDVLQSAYIVERYFNEQISCDFDFEKQQMIVSQNSMTFMPGQMLEITAGIGAFITTNNPQIFIDGIAQEINADGVAIYKKIVENKMNNEVPIRIFFINPNTGKKETATKIITYKVLNKTHH